MRILKILLAASPLFVFALSMAEAQRISSDDVSPNHLQWMILNRSPKISDSLDRDALSSRIVFHSPPSEEKSVFKAVLFSLILPGMGELYSDGFGSGKYFLVAESGLWMTFTGFELYGHWLENDARRFAASRASASIDGKDDQFFVNVGNFNNVYDYNEKKLRDRDISKPYDPNGPFFWQWDSEQSRLQFRDLRVKSDNVFNNVRFVIGAIIVNHIASAINAARLASDRNKEFSQGGWEFHTGLLANSPYPDGVVFTVRKTF